MTDDSAPLLLLVDDERANLALLERIFTGSYRVISVTGGQDALDMLAQAPFDLVLLDIMMPRMSGLDTLQHIRGNPRTADLPVILISALSDTRDVVRGLQMGANDYLPKPIQTDVLMARVQTQVTLKRLQDERKNTIGELQAAQEMKDRFFRIASHDLKSPLGNISLIRHLLRESLQDNDGAVHFLDMLDTAVDQMASVIHDFLEIAALESGRVDVKITDVSVRNLIATIVEQYQLSAENKGLAFEVEGTNAWIQADHTRMAQALDNLISNAVKYSPQDSVIAITTDVGSDRVRICVSDQGPGIPSDERDRLFTQFGKLSTRPTGGESSTGLGLWIVKNLVQLQGGQVGVDAASGGGSCFWIEMRLATHVETEPA